MHGSEVDFVIYRGITERYSKWFVREVLDSIYMDEYRYTFWVPEDERPYHYYEMTLVESDSVFLRKTNGEVFCTTMHVFENLYDIFFYDGFTNSGVAAFDEDCIDYVECEPGVLSAEYPDWFYEYFTEAVHFPPDNESIFIYDTGYTTKPIFNSSGSTVVIEPLNATQGQASVTEHCVFLKNRFGEIRAMSFEDFTKYYNTGPLGGRNYEY